MSTFGDYETIGEPIETHEDSDHFTRVWRAKRISITGARLYALKCYIPRRHGRVGAAPKDALEAHRSLDFIEGVKQIKKAAEGGKKHLTPIYEFGLAPWGEGAWYLTDFYGDVSPVLPRSLRSYIIGGGRVDDDALQHTIHSVVLGCLELKRSRGFSHGNLKTSNVFRVGKPRALRKTPLLLADAFPAAPLQLAQLDPQNNIETGDRLTEAMETKDLRAIGELILQLVEVRLVSFPADYDYPIGPSPAWDRLDRGERWRDLCNRLLDPNLSLKRTNLEAIEKEVRPGLGSGRAPIIAGAVVLACLMGVGAYYGIRWIEAMREELYKKDMTEAGKAETASKSNPTNIVGALNWVDKALKMRPGDTDASQLQTRINEDLDKYFAEALSEGQKDWAEHKFNESLKQADKALSLKPNDADAKKLRKAAQTQLDAIALARRMEADYQTAMKDGRAAFARGDYSNALTQADKALSLKPNDANATQLRKDAQTKLDAIAEAKAREEARAKAERDRIAAEAKAKAAAEAKAREEARAKAERDRIAAEAKTKAAAEAKAREETRVKSEQARIAAEAKAKADAEAKAREDARVKSEQERIAAEAKAKADAEAKAHEDSRVKSEQARIAAEAKAKADAEAKAHEDSRVKSEQARIAAEAKAKADAEAKAREDARAKSEQERIAAEAKAKADADAKAREDARVKSEQEKIAAEAKAKADAVAANSQQRQPTNFGDILGGNIPDLNFVWVNGIGSGGRGAYVSVNELSRGQYKALLPNGAGLNAGDDSKPAAFNPDTAKTFVDSLSAKAAAKGLKFRLPSLDEYKRLSGVTDLTATPIKSDGEDFTHTLFPKEITKVQTTDSTGLRNLIGNVREWTSDGSPFGYSYSWTTAVSHNMTDKAKDAEQIGLRLICEPTK